MRRVKGFTLIELMIVVAIIAILASIAIPAYQNYVARSQASAGLADLAGAKSSFETLLINDTIITTTPSSIGLATSTARCSLIEIDSNPPGFMRCTLRGNPAVQGKVLTLARGNSGFWSCSISGGILAVHLPEGCTN
jgi:type IV pilus assembly protein PilA